MSVPSIRRLSLLALLSLLPVGAFLVGRGGLEIGLSVVSVLLIAGSLYAMGGDADESHGSAA